MQDIAKGETLLYAGIGRDVWLLFGICNAKQVIAYDIVDPDYAYVIPKNKIQGADTASYQLQAYSNELRKEISILDDRFHPMLIDVEENMFRIKFNFRGEPRTLVVYVGDFFKVKEFPKAKGIIFGAGLPKTQTRLDQMLEQTRAN